MLFGSILVGLSALASVAVAQQKIHITAGPNGSLQAGSSVEIAWAGGDGQPVSLLLKNGPSTALKTVDTIASNLDTNTYTWSIDSSLPDGSYSLEIDQGSNTNYYGPFTIGGSSATSASASASASASITGSASSSASGSASLSAAAANSTISSILSSVSSALNATLGAKTTSGAASTGTGTALARNTTLSSATLTKTSTTKTATTSTAAASTTAAASSSAAGAASTSTSAPNPNSAPSLASPLALVLSAVVAMIFLH
ncbi:MAG: hypothetical protein M4579_003967 [Chaenotheca gracillima]|nr:MAG: hypothetical protein M4579_003967 [Chaenotheca gracillima]